MDETRFMGMFVIASITVWALVRSILEFQKNNMKERNEQSEKNTKATRELTEQLIKLTSSFEHHYRDDKKRDARIDSHSEQLDKHENRITVLETRG